MFRKRWLRWTKLFDIIESRIRVHKQYFSGFSTTKVGSIELHAFTVTSEEAYTCAAYFLATIMGSGRIRLVMVKAKVATLTFLSVPRLELSGGKISYLSNRPPCYVDRLEDNIILDPIATSLLSAIRGVLCGRNPR